MERRLVVEELSPSRGQSCLDQSEELNVLQRDIEKLKEMKENFDAAWSEKDC